MNCLRLLFLSGPEHTAWRIIPSTYYYLHVWVFFNYPFLWQLPNKDSSLSFSLSFQLVLKLQTKNGVDHFLEACSREERDRWAGDITSVVDKLRGSQVTNQEEPDASQLHNINLG